MTKKSNTKGIKAGPRKKSPQLNHPNYKWTPELRQASFKRVIDRIAVEKMSLSKALLVGDEMTRTMFYDHMKDFQLEDDYVKACDDRADGMFEEMVEVSQNPQWYEEYCRTYDALGNLKENKLTKKEMLGHRRLKVDTYKWALGKMRPKKYGDKQTISHEGELNTAPKPDLSALTNEELKLFIQLQNKIKPKEV